ncbi:hypothetical protein BRC81_07395, partial [Halobacteriales archaeon QS_1_68_20]
MTRDNDTERRRPDVRTSLDQWLDSRRGVLRKGIAASTAFTLGASAATGAASAQQDAPFGAVEFQNQTSDGTTVVVDSAILERGGFVTIHDGRLFEGQVTGSVIGVSDYVEPGGADHLTIDLFDVPGAQFDQSQLQNTQPLVAMPH